MKNIEKAQEEIGKNIRFIQSLLGLSDKSFYSGLNSSEPTLKKILNSDSQVYIDLYIQVAFLFGMRLEELTNRTLRLPHNFREILLSYHSFIDSEALLALSQRPKTNYAIERLLKSESLNDFMKAEKIQQEIENLIGHTYSVSTLSTAIQNFKDQIISRPAADNSNHKEYKLKTPFTEDHLTTYTPSYIRLAQYLSPNPNRHISFDILFKMFEILIQIKDAPKLGEDILRSFKRTPFNVTNVEIHFIPLQEANLISVEKRAGNDYLYHITDKGMDVL
ncbi:hypothetical protein [Arcticibacter tournemirensis]|uniref:Uncharacterized protein n=1 Tax=Arcticibacter tournemirensis TaxID=699437 RepID=A0A4Q0MA38_9SPHI|nr:hypothetical protein [Arcticibacter tournemirensis]RXF70087.1 hypothetical protein EKH83_09380 [Arcticibacter tournemirensis]